MYVDDRHWQYEEIMARGLKIKNRYRDREVARGWDIVPKRKEVGS